MMCVGGERLMRARGRDAKHDRRRGVTDRAKTYSTERENESTRKPSGEVHELGSNPGSCHLCCKTSLEGYLYATNSGSWSTNCWIAFLEATDILAAPTPDVLPSLYWNWCTSELGTPYITLSASPSSPQLVSSLFFPNMLVKPNRLFLLDGVLLFVPVPLVSTLLIRSLWDRAWD